VHQKQLPSEQAQHSEQNHPLQKSHTARAQWSLAR
jgi:hypothetical protein